MCATLCACVVRACLFCYCVARCSECKRACEIVAREKVRDGRRSENTLICEIATDLRRLHDCGEVWQRKNRTGAMERLMAEVAQRPLREQEAAELARRHRAFIMRERSRQAIAIRNAQRERGWCAAARNAHAAVAHPRNTLSQFARALSAGTLPSSGPSRPTFAASSRRRPSHGAAMRSYTCRRRETLRRC